MSTALKELLRERGQSIRGAALALGVYPPLFNAYANGQRPNKRNAQRIADGLKVKVRDLWPDFDNLRDW